MNSIDIPITTNEAANMKCNKSFYTNTTINTEPIHVILGSTPVKKKKRKSFKSIMADMTSKTTTLEQDKLNHKDQLQITMQHAKFNKLDRI